MNSKIETTNEQRLNVRASLLGPAMLDSIIEMLAYLEEKDKEAYILFREILKSHHVGII
jgi:hypothetical protein